MSLLEAYEDDKKYPEEERCLDENTVRRLLRGGVTTLFEALDHLDKREILFKRYCPLSSSAETPPLATHIHDLDYLLDGGLPMMHITEICGLPDAGKTQLIYTVCTNISLIGNKCTIYVDTKGDFSARRFKQILSLNCKEEKSIGVNMERIKIINITNMNELIKFLHYLKRNGEVMKNVSAIFVDSLPALMLQYQGEKFKRSLGLLNHFVNIARLLSFKYEIAFVVVNLFTRWVEGRSFRETADSSSSNSTVTFQPTLGKYWKSIPFIHIEISKERQDRPNIKIKIRNCDNVSSMAINAKIENKGVVVT